MSDRKKSPQELCAISDQEQAWAEAKNLFTDIKRIAKFGPDSMSDGPIINCCVNLVCGELIFREATLLIELSEEK